MNRVARNEPYPCGSGKKFKRCCGTDMPEQKLSADSAIPPDVRDVTLSVMGLPAQSGALHVINHSKKATLETTRFRKVYSAKLGNYQVTFVLARLGYSLLPEGKFSFANGLQGDSHLAIARPAFTPPNNPGADRIHIYGRTEDGNFTFEGYPTIARRMLKTEFPSEVLSYVREDGQFCELTRDC
jgi:hypothetical protein